MQPKYPQKLTFNFIKQFSCEGQSVSFNELNLRKCLTIRLEMPKIEPQQQQLQASAMTDVEL